MSLTTQRSGLKQLTSRVALVLLFLGVAFLSSQVLADSPTIGKAAQERLAEAQAAPKEMVTSDNLMKLLDAIKGLSLLVVVLVGFVLYKVVQLTGFDPFKNINANKANGLGFLLFGLGFFAFIGYELKYHTKHLLPEAASKHGADVDMLFIVTLTITGIVFIIVQALLFFWAFKFQHSKTRRAIYYHDNSRLETLWTIIPAIGMAAIVLYGVLVWQDMNSYRSDEKAINYEFAAEQFAWRIRHAGTDNALGRYKFEFLSTNNPVGVDSSDAKLQDDFVVADTIVLPLNRLVRFNIRSRDVLHGVYAPHFRVNMYAVPGLPTEINFVPSITTDEMRTKTNNPNFNYELACSQLCGISHYNMRRVLKVVTEAEYDAWVKAQPKFLPVAAPASAPTPETAPADTTKPAVISATHTVVTNG